MLQTVLLVFLLAVTVLLALHMRRRESRYLRLEHRPRPGGETSNFDRVMEKRNEKTLGKKSPPKN